MQMIAVSSSNIASIGYENGILYVSFNNGALYSYSGVPEVEYRNLMSTASHGQYLAAHIKGFYPYQRIG
jgi:hypothetical protein bpseD_00470